MADFSLYFAKFLITGYTSILAPLLPLLMLEMKLTLTQAGGLVALFSLFTSLLQPIFGWAQDRVGWRPFLLAAPLWVGAWMGVLGSAPGFEALVAVVLLGGIGICAFHPASFAAIGCRGDGPDRRANAISLLLFASSLGFVAGPTLVSFFAGRFGVAQLWFICIPGIAATLLLGRSFPKSALTGNSGPAETRRRAGPLFPLRAIVSPILPFFLVALSISIAAMNLYSFLPILLKERGAAAETIGIHLSLFALGCAVGPLAGSLSAGRFGRFLTLVSGSVLSFAGLILLLYLLAGAGPGFCLPATLIFLGIVLMFPFSLLIGMAQEKAPHYLGSVSSLLGGFAWGCGGVLVILFARLAERFGVEGVFVSLLVFPVFNLAVILLSGSRKKNGE